MEFKYALTFEPNVKFSSHDWNPNKWRGFLVFMRISSEQRNRFHIPNTSVDTTTFHIFAQYILKWMKNTLKKYNIHSDAGGNMRFIIRNSFRSQEYYWLHLIICSSDISLTDIHRQKTQLFNTYTFGDRVVWQASSNVFPARLTDWPISTSQYGAHDFCLCPPFASLLSSRFARFELSDCMRVHTNVTCRNHIRMSIR